MTPIRTTQTLARRQLDGRLAGMAAVVGPRPHRGWIRAIRTALGMSTMEMAQRMGVTQSRISQIERAEADDSIHLATLRRAAEALGCELHYVFVPSAPLEDTVRHQARTMAQALVGAATHTMRLEDQEPDASVVGAQLDQLTERLIDSRGLWAPSDDER
jgi:predicted DNA-binding mobile mystery protein A